MHFGIRTWPLRRQPKVLWDTGVPTSLCKGAEPSLSHAQELHSFFYFVSDLQKQKYLLANYEGPESSY